MTAAPAQVDYLAEAFPPLRLPRAYVPVEPTLKQEWFLRQDAYEAFFGGAAGPGKSWGLLMAALQYVDVGDYHALLLRPTLSEFEQPGGLIEVSTRWLSGTNASWNGTHREWKFPSGATVRFGYLRHVNHLARYKGPSYSFAGFDELTSFSEALYRAMFRVLRQATVGLEDVPLRMRAASNPGDRGHIWVKTRFVEPSSREPGAAYVPAKITDNPHMDVKTYIATSLSHLSAVDQLRLINGDWDVAEEGGKFRRDAFTVIDTAPVGPKKELRYWDLAASEPNDAYPDPDYTVGLRYQLNQDDSFTITDVVMERVGDTAVEQLVRAVALADGPGVPVYIEQDPGQAGKAQFSNYARRVLQGFPVRRGLTRINGVNAAKEVRARPVAAAVGNKLVTLVRGANTTAFLDQVSLFPLVGIHDDCVDALSGAHNSITRDGTTLRSHSSVPRGTIPQRTAERGEVLTDALRRRRA